MRRMSDGPSSPWKVETSPGHYRRLIIIVCLIATTGFIITLSYCNKFSVNLDLKGYKFKGLKSAQSNTSLDSAIISRQDRAKVLSQTFQAVGDEEEESTLEDVVNDTDTSGDGNVNRTVYVEDEAVEISWNDTRLDILHMPRLQFDRRFKNPCWFEPLASPRPYINNTIILFSPSAKKTLHKLTKIWESIYEEEDEPFRLRCLPYFMIIGQPKCGSTDLFWKIVKHPNIDHPPIKELHWWTRSRQGRRFSNSRISPFVDYVDMFDSPSLRIHTRLRNISEQMDDHGTIDSQIITGEASVSLFWDNNDWMKFPENWNQEDPVYLIPHYIHHVIPDVKLILMFREPTERLYSDYLYFHSDRKSADDFHSSVVQAITLYNSCVKSRGPRACVYDTDLSLKVRVRLRIGMYSVFLKDWLSVFSESQFYVVRLEDYSKNQMKYLHQIYSFLGQRPLSGAEEVALFEDEIWNSRKVSDVRLGGMHNETRQLLQTFYHPYNVDLSTMLRDKRFLWTDHIS